MLVETIWTLKGRWYNLDKEAIIKVVHSVLKNPTSYLKVGKHFGSINDFKYTKSIKSGGKRKEADCFDALIVNKAHYIAGEIARSLEGVYTFDVAAQQIPGTEKP